MTGQILFDPLGAFADGMELGERFGRQSRNARAYRQGGLGAVTEAAGRAGDLEGYGDAQRVANDALVLDRNRIAGAQARIGQIAPFANAALRRAQQLPPDQRAAFLRQPHILSRFTGWGLSKEDIDRSIATLSDPATADAEFEAIFAALRGEIDWQVVGDSIGGIDPQSGQWVEGGPAPEGAGRQWRALTEAEVAELGLRPGTTAQVHRQTGQVRVIQPPAAAQAGAGDYPDDGYDYEAQ